MFLIIGRTIAQSITNIRRNFWLGITATSVLVLSLYATGYFYVRMVSAGNVLKDIESKINVSIYFKSQVTEEKIMSVKQDLEKYKEVESVDYVNKEKALEDFKRNNADEPTILLSLEEIGDNPLLASLVVKAESPDQYGVISEYVNKSSFSDDVSLLNYNRNKYMIDKLNESINRVKKEGLILGVIFGIVSVLIIFNTIRITIYVHRQEIEVMRLVGASNVFIRLPFVFEGILYGLASALLASGFLFLTVKFINPSASFISSQVISENYFRNIFIVFAIQSVFGIFLGVFSSWIAMRKYLKV